MSTIGTDSPKRHRSASFGSIRKRSGNWVASFQNPRYGTHKDEPQRLQKTFQLKTTARAWLDATRVEIDRGQWRSPRERELERLTQAVTFGAYSSQWMSISTHKPSTVRTYRAILRNHLLPEWEHAPLDEISIPRVNEWVAHRLSPHKDGARKTALELFRAILRSAVDDELISTVPVTRKALKQSQHKRNPSTRHAPRDLTKGEINAILEAVSDEYRPILTFIAFTGVRIGEARELRRKDLDLEAGTVSICRTATNDGKNLVIGLPKSEAGIRTLPLPVTLLAFLTEHLESQGLRAPNALLFPRANDPEAHLVDTSIRKQVSQASKARGLPHTSPHDFRHTVTSTLIANGASPTDVQAWLGHSSPSMTLHYAHSRERSRVLIADGLEQALAGTEPLNVTPLRKAETA